MKAIEARTNKRTGSAFLLCWAVAVAAGIAETNATGETRQIARGGTVARAPEQELRISECKWSRIVINAKRFEEDVVIDQHAARERNKKPSKKYQARFGHTPISLEEEIPWECQELVIGIGFQSRLPVMNEVKAEAAKRKVKLILLPTPQAVEYFKTHQAGRNAIFHLTC